MRLQIEDILAEITLRLDGEKSIRNSIYLKNVISELKKYRTAAEKNPIE